MSVAPVRLSFEDIQRPPRERFALGRMFPLAKASVFFGPTSVGKSAAAAQVVFAFAAGAQALWGLPICCDEETDERGGSVLVYSAEDDLDDWKRKGAAILCGGDIDMKRALERFYFMDESEGLARLVEIVTHHAGDGIESVTRRIARPTEEQDHLIERAREVGAKLILVETASRLVADEDNASFSGLQSALGRIARKTGAAVIISHHSTKAATKENDNAIESARGGGALICNARNAVSLFPAEPEVAKRYRDRFPEDDVVVLGHGKPTSSTRRQAPITLVRTDATWGAVFRLPDEVAFTPEEQEKNAIRLEQAREQERERLGKLYDVVERVLPTRPLLSSSWLRDNMAREIGVPARQVESLVTLALEHGVLQIGTRNQRGVTVILGHDPRKPIRPNPSESTDE